MDKYLIISSNDPRINNQADTIQEAREKVRELFDSPSNYYYPRGIYKLVETHELRRDIKVTPCDSPEDAPKGASSADTTEYESISLIELVNKDMPNVEMFSSGCPDAAKFTPVFEKYGYVQPDKPYDEDSCYDCEECWNRPAVKKPEKEEPTLIEIVRRTKPNTSTTHDGCPSKDAFKKAFESAGYVQPETYDCSGINCDECWNRPAVKKPEKPLTRLEVVHKTMPEIKYAGDGCPWYAGKFQKAFESQGYKFPGKKALLECHKFTCEECWNEPAERLIPTDGE